MQIRDILSVECSHVQYPSSVLMSRILWFLARIFVFMVKSYVEK